MMLGMSPIARAIQHFGNQSALAAALGVRQPTVSEWLRGDRPVPIERCTAIEQASSGAVRRWDLRPDDWHRIWPELIGAEGAPEAPTLATEVSDAG